MSLCSDVQTVDLKDPRRTPKEAKDLLIAEVPVGGLCRGRKPIDKQVPAVLALCRFETLMAAGVGLPERGIVWPT